jgi:hypothetical protein
MARSKVALIPGRRAQVGQQQVESANTTGFISAGSLHRVADRGEPALEPRSDLSRHDSASQHALRRGQSLCQAISAGGKTRVIGAPTGLAEPAVRDHFSLRLSGQDRYLYRLSCAFSPDIMTMPAIQPSLIILAQKLSTD